MKFLIEKFINFLFSNPVAISFGPILLQIIITFFSPFSTSQSTSPVLSSTPPIPPFQFIYNDIGEPIDNSTISNIIKWYGPTVSWLTLISTVVSALLSLFVVVSLIFFPTRTSTLNQRKPSFLVFLKFSKLSNRSSRQLKNPFRTALSELVYPIIFNMFISDFVFSFISLPIMILYCVLNCFYALQLQPDKPDLFGQYKKFVFTSIFVGAAEILEMVYISSSIWSFFVTFVLYFMFRNTLNELKKREKEKNKKYLEKKEIIKKVEIKNSKLEENFALEEDEDEDFGIPDDNENENENENDNENENFEYGEGEDNANNNGYYKPPNLVDSKKQINSTPTTPILTPNSKLKIKPKHKNFSLLLSSQQRRKSRVLKVDKREFSNNSYIDNLKRIFMLCFYTIGWGFPFIFQIFFFFIFMTNVYTEPLQGNWKRFAVLSRLFGDVSKTVFYVILEGFSIIIRFSIIFMSWKIKKKLPSSHQKSQIHIISQLLSYFLPFFICTSMLITCRFVYIIDLLIRIIKSKSLVINMDFNFLELLLIGINRIVFPLRGMLDAIIYIVISNQLFNYFKNFMKKLFQKLFKKNDENKNTYQRRSSHIVEKIVEEEKAIHQNYGGY